jgi:general secretion pathway protein G
MIRRHSMLRQPVWSTLMRNTTVARTFAARRRASGFTLIEIMVVVVIIGLLAAVIVPEVVSKVEQARVAKARQDIQALTTALTMYRIDNFKYPTTDQGLQALVQQPADPNIKNWKPGGYISQGSLKDPWGNDYQYVYPGTHGREYDLFSLGANGQDTSGDSSTVIGNWNLDGSSGANGATAALGGR